MKKLPTVKQIKKDLKVSKKPDFMYNLEIITPLNREELLREFYKLKIDNIRINTIWKREA